MCIVVFGLAFVTGGVADAQTANPLSAGAKRSYEIIKGYITRSAEKVPESDYAFKPSPDVRSFGQLVGHVADANNGFCALAAGEKPPAGTFEGPVGPIEKSATTKAALQKALADSFAYCDKVHGGMTDAAGAAMVKSVVGEMPKLGLLEFNTHHDFEHYGNMVTYMRLKKIVPPSSEPRK
ncbi:MAG TPA: DinB family protein [Vicinamibacterales bacterium]|jgi:uncharacterized damage-inducible protein DinB